MAAVTGTNQHYSLREFKDFLGPRSSDYELTVARHQYKYLWTYIANSILAIWLITSPCVFDYHSHPLAVSDITSGLLILLCEFVAFSPKRALARWLTPAVAFWLLFAPLVFWSPTPAVYLLDTLIGIMVIAFSVIVPGVPGKGGVDMPGPDHPPGWSYNPSSWIRRWLGIALALVGFLISRYLAAHQLGYTGHAFDPFFGAGSDKVLTSSVSRSFPISDAGFGGVAYALEMLTGFMGDRARWRTAPWIVVLFALLVLPLGTTSIVLVMMQSMVVGAWCGLCLIAAAALLTSVPLAVHEVIAMGQFLRDARAEKKNFWQIFWMGGSVEGAGAPDPDRTRFTLKQRFVESVRGVTVPWVSFVQIATGIWLMARPDLIAFDKATANCDHLVGALIVTVAAIATAEVTRTARLLNIPLGIALIGCSIIFAAHSQVVLISELLSGAIVIVASLPKDKIFEKYADWERFIK